jgi:hypothetical protein
MAIVDGLTLAGIGFLDIIPTALVAIKIEKGAKNV